MSNLKNKISKIISDKPSNWRWKAKFRKERPWLREYSSQIARRILTVIKENKELNQVKLAELVSVAPQQIHKIVKGQENLTLETIYKLSKALNYELITFPPYKLSIRKTMEVSAIADAQVFVIINVLMHSTFVIDDNKLNPVYKSNLSYQTNYLLNK